MLDDYFDALNRLKQNKPIRAPKGTRISNDSVSVEAGRKKGTIKKSRPIFIELIAAIDAATLEQASEASRKDNRLKTVEALAEKYRIERNEAFAREISLVRELYAAKAELAALTGKNILPIRGGARN